MSNEQEPTVQMPVSLIERASDFIDMRLPGAPAVLADLRALLSQPTPTAEPAVEKAWNEGWQSGWANRHQAQPDQDGTVGLSRPIENPYTARGAEPPRIEDLAPGTRFVIHRAEHWTVLPHRVAVQDGHDTGRYLEEFDPSTIRDVQPPKEQS